MTITPQRSAPVQPAGAGANPTELLTGSVDFVEPSFDEEQWRERTVEERGSGGRQVLATGLVILATLWTGYSSWSAGRSLSSQTLSSPLIAQWIAVAAGPLALMGLVWLMFGRTRRKESERFTRSAIAPGRTSASSARTTTCCRRISRTAATPSK